MHRNYSDFDKMVRANYQRRGSALIVLEYEKARDRRRLRFWFALSLGLFTGALLLVAACSTLAMIAQQAIVNP